MKTLIKRVVANKLRKRGKEYRSSENTKLSGQDFAYANKITSKIYHALTKTSEIKKNRALYQRLLRKVIKIIRADEVHELGQLRIGFGNIQDLVGFRLNERKSIEGLVHWLPKIDFGIAPPTISIHVPEITETTLHSLPQSVVRTETKFHVFKIPIETTEEVAHLSTKYLIHLRHSTIPSRTARLSLDGWDNCLILVVGMVHCYLWSESEKEEFMTLNQQLMACDILAIYGLRDGKLIQDRPYEEIQKQLPSQDQGVDWA